MSTILRPVGPVVSAIPKPPLRRPNLVRKRDDDEDEVPSSPGKRAKVTFDSDVEVRVVDDWEQAPEVIFEEVRLAFSKRLLGDSSGYERIKDIYTAKRNEADESSPMTLKSYTLALLGNISALTKSNSDLIHTVLKSEWLGRREDYVALYVRLLANLASAQGMFLGEIMRMLVDNITAAPPSNGRLQNLSVVPSSMIYARAHKAIQILLQVMPSASRILCSTLIHAFPHETDSRRSHIIYVQNLLKLIVYAPELREEVLRLITERLVKIDVQVQVDLEDLAEEDEEGLVDKIRPDLMEDMQDSDSSDEESDSDEYEEDADAQRTKNITKNVEKMDAILDILFSHYDQAFTKASTEDQMRSFNVLLSQFITIILPTHRSRHTQFLIFHFSQKSTAYIDTYVGACAQITFDRNQPAIIRQASTAYLASFVARGIHVPSSIVREVFDYLASELEHFRRQNEPSCRGPDMRRYSSFYVLVQAMLYIFCFRWRDLESSPDDELEDDDLEAYGQQHQWRSGIKEALSRNVFSKLNPLKVCSPAIVTEFSRLANHLGIVYVFHLLETNKRVRVQHYAGNAYSQINRETALSARNDEDHQHLDEYFPFDPYHLPKSKRWIEGDYREWAGISGLDDREGSESGSDEEEAADSEGEEDTETDGTSRSL